MPARQRRSLGCARALASDSCGYQAESRSQSIAKVVSARGQHAQRMGEQSDEQQPDDHHQVYGEDQAKAFVLRHVLRYAVDPASIGAWVGPVAALAFQLSGSAAAARSSTPGRRW